uniref:Rhodopsin domain-containing protein n=1 Tax=Bionectria ochroleuca TaxID=29856 RepID=A0A8H7NP52_BIOOC
MAIMEDVTSINPQGLGLVLLVVTLFITPLTVIVIALRCGVRLKHNVFGMDDALMVVGWALFMVVAGLVSKGTYYGLGARDLATSCISTIIVIVGLFAMCRPIRVNWDAKAGTCSPPIVIVSAAAVATDWVCAILPGFMLQGPDENSNQGFYQASIATIVRLPYIKFYAEIIDYPYNVGNITLWPVFESGTGIIAGSLPSLRRLLKNWVNFDSSGEHSLSNFTLYAGALRSTVTSKTGVSSTARRHKSIVSHVESSDRDWEQLDDASSSRKIYVTVDMEMHSVERPTTSSKSRESSSKR